MKATLFQSLVAVAAAYRQRFLLGFALVACSNFLLIATPMTFRQAVLAFDGSQEIWPMLAIWMGILIAISLIASLFKYKMRMVFIEVSRDAENQVRAMLYQKIQNQSSAFFDRHRIGSLMSRLTNDLSAYRDVLGPGIMYPIYFFTLMVPAFISMFYISPYMTLISAVPILILPLLMLVMRKVTFSNSLKAQELLGDMSTMAQEHYSGIRIVKGFGIEGPTFRRFCELCREFVRVSLNLSFIKGIIFPLLALITKSTTALLVMFMGLIVYKGWGYMDTADFVSFMWIQSYLFIPVLMLGWTLPLYIHGAAAYKRLVEIYEEPVEVQDASDALLAVPEDMTLEVKNVSFTYPRGKMPALNGVSITLSPGEWVGITGPVGGGKSTIVRILSRDYEIPHGMYFLGNREIHEYSVSLIRNQMTVVDQHPFLFSASIKDNLLHGNPHATEEELVVALKNADLLKTVEEFPEGIETQIGERGVTLSGGQKQRLALARAFLVNRPIMLLDDVFSSVDSSTERQIFHNMKAAFGKNTVLLITHRVSVLEQMDRIEYVVDGRIEESGTHEALMKRSGHYAALAELQLLQGRYEG